VISGALLFVFVVVWVNGAVEKKVEPSRNCLPNLERISGIMPQFVKKPIELDVRVASDR
jgi:hypothetical protein